MQYNIKIKDIVITISGKKELVEKLSHKLKEPFHLHQYYREIEGVIGEQERTSSYYLPLSPAPVPVRNIGEYNQKIVQYFEMLNGKSNRVNKIEDFKEILEFAKVIYEEHVGIKDSRITQEQKQENNNIIKENENKRKKEKEEFLSEYSNGKEVTIPSDSMAVYLQITYNDSDSMADYFHPHANYGSPLLLAVVSKQFQKEALARRIVAMYEELKDIEFKWKVENYSGGHGNYLQGDNAIPLDQERYRGGKAIGRYEVQFSSYNKNMFCFRGYPGVETKKISICEELSEVIIRHNENKNGIEIKFPNKPSSNIISLLKQKGFRWSSKNFLWYNKFTPELFSECQELLLKKEEV